MRLIQTRNPSVIKMLKEQLIPDSDYPVENMIADLETYMEHFGDSFLALTLWQEPQELKGFVLAYVPPGRGHLFIVQAWVDNDVEQEWREKLFELMKTFAEEKGVSEIRGETLRSPMALTRRWDFQVHSTIMILRLEDQGGTDK